uniref:Cytochrome c oxidase subunit 3 n=1 Tax=Chamberlainia hainesiana TaxID=1264661 RepID=A0A513X0A8_9BIVA|nr:cytochrome c oxidase subunit 3 [Chamberlainia hainesiana]
MRSPFHLVEMSPWPILFSVSLFCSVVGFVDLIYGGSLLLMFCGVIGAILVLGQWWRDVIRESNQGWHTSYVAWNIRLGMVLFIVSEVMFFFSFFWAFFSCALMPGVEAGGVWPPVGVIPLDPMGFPLLSTAVLLSSGVSITWAHYAVMAGNRVEGIYGLFFTIVLGMYFTCLQIFEFLECSFSIADGVWGSLFYIMTGFHGVHVVFGTVALVVCLWRLFGMGFSSERHLGFELSIWYWHFVDVVWICLFLSVYWWGG